jgi:hypothetical protein
MKKRRDTKEYRDGCRSFVEFVVGNCIVPNGKIYCPCTVCRLNRRYPPTVVLAHLTGGNAYFLHIRIGCFIVRSLYGVKLNYLL